MQVHGLTRGPTGTGSFKGGVEKSLGFPWVTNSAETLWRDWQWSVTGAGGGRRGFPSLKAAALQSPPEQVAPQPVLGRRAP